MSASVDPPQDDLCSRARDAHRQLIEGARARALSGTDAVRVERLIVGGGLAATLCWATGRGEGLVVARAEEPWWSRRRWRLGQPASELVSEGFVLQPHEFAEDVDGFAPASALADAIAVTAHEHGLPLVLGCCVERPIERTEDGRFVVWVGERRIEAERVDVAVGLGPPRRLRDRDGNATIVTEEDERALLADGRMVFGQEQWRHPVRGSRVLVLGGGPTAAWNVERARAEGAAVTWLAKKRTEPVDGDPLRRKADELARWLEQAPDSERRRWFERIWARIVAFRGADLARNRAVFRMRNVEWWVGSVERLQPQGDGVDVTIRPEDQNASLQRHFDQVIVSIGQDDSASSASAALVRGMSMTWLESNGRAVRRGDPRRPPSGRIVGACEASDNPRLRCLGVVLRSPEWRKILPGTGRRRSNAVPALEARLQKQADCAPEHSRGIHGAVFQVSANVVLANGHPLQPELGAERYDFLTSTLVLPKLRAAENATSSGEGG